MKIVSSIGVALLVSVTFHPALAQEKPGADSMVVGATAPGQAGMARITRINATVESIDQATRKVTLKGPRGKSIPVVAGPEVRDLDKVKVGDQVAVEYVEALSLTLKKNGKELRGSKQSAGGARSAPGQPPAGAVAQQVQITADVTAVNRKKHIVTLRGPQQTVDLVVRDPEQLKLIKVGDQVEAVYTEALALGLNPARPQGK